MRSFSRVFINHRRSGMAMVSARECAVFQGRFREVVEERIAHAMGRQFCLCRKLAVTIPWDVLVRHIGATFTLGLDFLP